MVIATKKMILIDSILLIMDKENENILTYVPMMNFVPGNEWDFDSDLDEG